LINLKKDSLDLKRQNTQLMSGLEQQRKILNQHGGSLADNQQMAGLKNNYESVVNKLHIIQNCLQACIVGTGCNWAQDETLRDVVLSLGQSLDELP